MRSTLVRLVLYLVFFTLSFVACWLGGITMGEWLIVVVLLFIFLTGGRDD